MDDQAGIEVFLLGAGFSKAVSPHMPLLRELSQQIAFRAEDYRSVADIGTNFERVLTFLAERQPWLSEAENLRNRATFLDISARISFALDSQQAKALGEPPPEWFLKLIARWREQRRWILTLNYDTLVERGYTELRRRTDQPNLRAVMAHRPLYPVPIESALSRTQLVLGHEEPASLRLLKLHGSLNWMYSGSDFPGETIYDIGIPPGWNKETLERDVLANAIDKVPLIIPPTLGKSSFFVNETVRSTWRLAHETLRAADFVYCLGYSLPEGDHNMIGLLRQSVQTAAVVFVVNRNAETAQRYEALLGDVVQVDTDFAGMPDAIPRFLESYLS